LLYRGLEISLEQLTLLVAVAVAAVVAVAVGGVVGGAVVVGGGDVNQRLQ
jgi:hypothetical protein